MHFEYFRRVIRAAANAIVLAGWASVLCVLLPSGAARAQGFLLVAQPSLTEENFIQTVVLAVPTEEGVTIGFVLNRPLEISLAQMLPDHPQFKRFEEPLRQGGPVNPTGLFALYRGAKPLGPTEQAAEGLYMVIEKATVEEIMTADVTAVRFYSGYAGWAPGQLESEIERGAWWVLEFDEEAVHRADPSNLWNDMVRRAQSVTARQGHDGIDAAEGAGMRGVRAAASPGLRPLLRTTAARQ